LFEQIETLEPDYRDTSQLLKQAKEKLQEEQAQKERQRLARLATEKAKAERAAAERVESERLEDEEVGRDVSVLRSPLTSAVAPQEQGQLRRLLSSVPVWIWAVVGVVAVVLSLVLGSLAGWWGAEEPTPTPTQAPTGRNTRSSIGYRKHGITNPNAHTNPNADRDSCPGTNAESRPRPSPNPFCGRYGDGLRSWRHFSDGQR
jgi:hypothetical protein